MANVACLSINSILLNSFFSMKKKFTARNKYWKWILCTQWYVSNPIDIHTSKGRVCIKWIHSKLDVTYCSQYERCKTPRKQKSFSIFSDENQFINFSWAYFVVLLVKSFHFIKTLGCTSIETIKCWRYKRASYHE